MFVTYVVLGSLLVGVSLAELPSSYAASGWRPTGPTFDLPNEYVAAQAQREPRLELEITKQRVDYAGQLRSGNERQVSPNSAYLPPSEIDESSVLDIIRYQGLPSRPSVQFNKFGQLNTREYYRQRPRMFLQRPQKFAGSSNNNNVISNGQKGLPIKFPSTQYGVPENQAVDGYASQRPEEPFNEGNEEIVDGSVTKGEYFVLTPEKTLQKVTYKTSQTEEEARTNSFTAELKYTPVDKIEGPLYKYNEQGQLVRIYKK